MIFLIQIPSQVHPYLSTLQFTAYDFQKWGHSVTSYPEGASHMKDIKRQQRKLKIERKRPALMEVWAREVISR
ncbi:hypothetical protein GQ44DRAFT_573579, partial [Phaeosphaeriaceae sp. PMI808]